MKEPRSFSLMDIVICTLAIAAIIILILFWIVTPPSDTLEQPPNSSSVEDISSVEISYLEENLDISYDVDVENKILEERIYKGGVEQSVSTTNYDPNKLVDFVNNRVLGVESVPPNETTEEQRITWSIKVNFVDSDKFFNQSGFAEPPAYWSDLLASLDEGINLQSSLRAVEPFDKDEADTEEYGAREKEFLKKNYDINPEDFEDLDLVTIFDKFELFYCDCPKEEVLEILESSKDLYANDGSRQ